MTFLILSSTYYLIFNTPNQLGALIVDILFSISLTSKSTSFWVAISSFYLCAITDDSRYNIFLFHSYMIEKFATRNRILRNYAHNFVSNMYLRSRKWGCLEPTRNGIQINITCLKLTLVLLNDRMSASVH